MHATSMVGLMLRLPVHPQHYSQSLFEIRRQLTWGSYCLNGLGPTKSMHKLASDAWCVHMHMQGRSET
jgi:hypothetical protein